MRFNPRKRPFAAGFAVVYIAIFAACVTQVPESVALHGWWQGLGPVIPHDTFPAKCELCHVGMGWQSLRDDFTFDHEAETGVPLDGAHISAQCLRCHNDRGPVAVFDAMGCAGCHEDLHLGELGSNCQTCHTETSWNPVGQISRHNQTRFPLVGVHAATACRRCHLGAEVGRFKHTSIVCLNCHQDDLARANNPNHAGLGYVDNCHRCHIPTNWNQAEVNQ